MTKKLLLIYLLLIIAPFTTIAQTDSIDDADLQEVTRANYDQLEPLFTLEVNGANDIAWSPDGTQLAVATDEGVLLYDTDDFDAEPRQLPIERAVRIITFLGNTNQLVANRVIYDTNTLEALRTIDTGEYWFNNAGTQYAVADREREAIVLFDLASGEELAEYPIFGMYEDCEFTCFLTDIVFSSDDRIIAFASPQDGTESGIINLETGERISPIRLGLYIELMIDDNLIVSIRGTFGYVTDAVLFTDSVLGEQVASINVYNPHFAFDRAEELMIVGAVDDSYSVDEASGILLYYDVAEILSTSESEREDALLEQPRSRWIADIAFSPDYHLLAIAEYDRNDWGLGDQIRIFGIPTD